MRLSAGFVSSCLRSVTSLLLAGAVSLALTGCQPVKQAGSAAVTTSTINLSMTGKVHGGQSPISGSSVTLYTQGGSAVASSTSDGNGDFTFGHLSCASGDTVYLEATGGNPGLASGTNNTAIDMVAQVGTCADAGSGFFVINELTTVASVEYGAGATSVVNASGAVSGGDVATLNTLANILAGCVNSTGATGPSDPCGKLFGVVFGGASGDSRVNAYTRPHAYALGGHSILDTMYAIASNPSANVPALLALTTGYSPFKPQLSTAPAQLTPAPPSTSGSGGDGGTGTGTGTGGGGTQPPPYVGMPAYNYGCTPSPTVVFSLPSSGASYYYTTNGTTPTTGSSPLTFKNGTATVNVTSSDDVEVLGHESGFTDYVIAARSSGGSISFTNTTATISGNSSCDTVYYTLDGTTPTISSPSILGTGTVTIGPNSLVVIMDKAPGLLPNGAYHYVTDEPLLSITAGNKVTMTDDDQYAKIYYTPDATTPTINSTPYPGNPVDVSSDETVQAIARAPGKAASGVNGVNTGAALGTLAGTCGSFVNSLTVDRQGNLYAACATDGTHVGVYKYASAGSGTTTVSPTQLFSFGMNNATTQSLQIDVTASGFLYVPSPDEQGVYRYVTTAQTKTLIPTGLANMQVTSYDDEAFIPSSTGFYTIDVDATTTAPPRAGGGNFSGCTAGIVADKYAGSYFFCATTAGTLSHVDIGGHSYMSWSTGGGTPTAFTQSPEGNDYLAVKGDGGSALMDITGTNGALTTLLGNGTPGTSADGTLVELASVNNPTAIAVDLTGTMYFAETGGAIRRVEYKGTHTKAGTPVLGTSGSNYTLTSASGGSVLFTVDGSTPSWQDYIAGGTTALASGPIPMSAVGNSTIKAVATTEITNNPTATYYDSDLLVTQPAP